jgi:hypothetical protein
MIKFSTRLAGISALLLLIIITAHAIPLYYTVSGAISTYKLNDEAGILQDMGLSSGDTVSYTFLIDLDSQITSSWSSIITNHFDVSLISGSVFGSRNVPNGTVHGDPWTGHGYNNYSYAANQYYPGQPYYGETQIDGFAPDGYIYLTNEMDYFLTGEVTQLQPGDFFSSFNYTVLYNENGEQSRFEIDQLTIDSVSPINTVSGVPEPGVVWLFGVGLITVLSRRYINH